MDPLGCRFPAAPRLLSRFRLLTFNVSLLAAILLLELASAGSAFAGLPPGWTDTDFGSPGQVGSADYSNGVWTVQGGGTDICSCDQFHLAWTPVNGEGSIVAQVRNLAN